LLSKLLAPTFRYREDGTYPEDELELLLDEEPPFPELEELPPPFPPPPPPPFLFQRSFTPSKNEP
jgi:hypothetical protein